MVAGARGLTGSATLGPLAVVAGARGLTGPGAPPGFLGVVTSSHARASGAGGGRGEGCEVVLGAGSLVLPHRGGLALSRSLGDDGVEFRDVRRLQLHGCGQGRLAGDRPLGQPGVVESLQVGVGVHPGHGPSGEPGGPLGGGQMAVLCPRDPREDRGLWVEGGELPIEVTSSPLLLHQPHGVHGGVVGVGCGGKGRTSRAQECHGGQRRASPDRQAAPAPAVSGGVTSSPTRDRGWVLGPPLRRRPAHEVLLPCGVPGWTPSVHRTGVRPVVPPT